MDDAHFRDGCQMWSVTQQSYITADTHTQTHTPADPHTHTHTRHAPGEQMGIPAREWPLVLSQGLTKCPASGFMREVRAIKRLAELVCFKATGPPPCSPATIRSHAVGCTSGR